MAHYAFIDQNNIVTEVIVGVDETETIDGLTPEQWYGNFRKQQCLRTSYNNNIRKNFAGIGYKYDFERDAFIPPKLFNSWILNEETCQWNPPSPYPSQGFYGWNEDTESWEEIING
jgi:hypothetical protein